MKLQHVMLRVYDIENSLVFYQNVLGLNVVKTLELKDSKLYFLAKDPEDPNLMLCYNYNHPEKYAHGNYYGFVGFEINSMEEFQANLKKQNGHFDREPFVSDNGTLIGFLKDPDGHRIEILQKSKS